MPPNAAPPQARRARLLITGATGFLGRRLVGRLASESDVVAVHYSSPSVSVSHVRWVGLDLCAAKAWREALKRFEPDVVIHLALPAGGKERSPENAHPITKMTDALLEGLQTFAPRLLISMGSADEYGSAPAPQAEAGPTHPTTEYGRAKLDSTRRLLTFGRENAPVVLVLRPFLVYGPRQPGSMFVPSCLQALTANETFLMTDGEQLRDPIFVDDVVRGISLAAAFGLAASASSQIINLCTGHGVRILDVARELQAQVGAGRLVPGGIPPRKGDPLALVGDPQKASELLGFRALVDWRKGLARTVRAAIDSGHPTRQESP